MGRSHDRHQKLGMAAAWESTAICVSWVFSVSVHKTCTSGLVFPLTQSSGPSAWSPARRPEGPPSSAPGLPGIPQPWPVLVWGRAVAWGPALAWGAFLSPHIDLHPCPPASPLSCTGSSLAGKSQLHSAVFSVVRGPTLDQLPPHVTNTA